MASLLGFAREAEALGAAALWAPDHLFWGQPILECLTTLTAVATSTSRAAIGSCVLQLPLREPAVVAKQATTLQVLSQGRFVLGLGVGRHRGEYEAAGGEFDTRGKTMDLALDAIRRAWATAEEPGLQYRQDPPSPPVPLWFGGSSDAALRRTAHWGDGWVPLFLSLEGYRSKLAQLARHAEAAGREPGEITPAVTLAVHVGSREQALQRGSEWLSKLFGIPARAFAGHLVAGPSSRCADTIWQYREAGARHLVLMVADDHPLDHFGALVDRFDTPAGGREPAETTR